MDDTILISLDEFDAAVGEIGDGFYHNTVMPTDMSAIKNTYTSTRNPFYAFNRAVNLLNTYHAHLESDSETCQRVGRNFYLADQGYTVETPRRKAPYEG